jgi:hypothetical protein
MRRKLTAALAAICMVGAVGAASPLAASNGAGMNGTAALAAAKPCSAGYKHAVIGDAHKCLRRGQFCARTRDRDYHRYGYHCHTRDSRGNYHLE